MEKMLVVVFDNESTAYEATRALADLDREGSISVHAESVIQKNADGSLTVKQTDTDFPIRSVAGTGIGSLIGLLGGPVGWAVGAAAGATAGMVGDLYTAGVNEDFVSSVVPALASGKFAVLADISEEWVTPLDTQMEALGGSVFRTSRESFEEEQRAREAAALKAEIEQLKAEHARAQADRKAKIQAKIDQLNSQLQQKLTQAQQRSEQIRHETEAKVLALEQRADKARGEAKAAFDGRIREIREAYDQSVARTKSIAAQQLRNAANKLEASHA